MEFKDVSNMSLEEMAQEYGGLNLEIQTSGVASILKRVAELEEAIKAHVKETGEVTGGVTYGKYTRSSWNSKALDGFAVAHPEIKQFKTETEVKTVKLDWAQMNTSGDDNDKSL